MKKLLGIVVLGLLFSGSADTAISFGSEKLLILTDQPGAHCVLTNNKGSWSVLTPGIVKVKRSKKKLNIFCNKEGYKETRTHHILRNTKEVDEDSVALNTGGTLAGVAQGDMLSAGLEALLLGTEIVDSKLGTYTNNVGLYKGKKKRSIFIKLNKN
jgi:hypothetical protein